MRSEKRLIFFKFIQVNEKKLMLYTAILSKIKPYRLNKIKYVFINHYILNTIKKKYI